MTDTQPAASHNGTYVERLPPALYAESKARARAAWLNGHPELAGAIRMAAELGFVPDHPLVGAAAEAAYNSGKKGWVD